MRHLTLITTGIILGIVGTLGAQTASNVFADRETTDAVTAVKNAIVRGHMEKDSTALARLYADDYAAVDADRTVRTRSDLLAGLRDDPTLVEGRYTLIAVRRWGSVAVASGRGHLVSKRDDGTTRTADYYSFNVFEKRDGEWKYVGAFLP